MMSFKSWGTAMGSSFLSARGDITATVQWRLAIRLTGFAPCFDCLPPPRGKRTALRLRSRHPYRW